MSTVARAIEPVLTKPLDPPAPYYGGKRKVTHIVWPRFGNPVNYIEPFFGMGAVLLGRPHEPRNETINDKDGYVANFWRALKHHPEGVATYADHPVNEIDLHARHAWLVSEKKDFTEWLISDPENFDSKKAGWWVWGLSAWIGSGWCDDTAYRKRIDIRPGGRGGYRAQMMPRPNLRPKNGVNKTFRKRIQAGKGRNGGVHATKYRIPHKIPHLSQTQGTHRKTIGDIYEYLQTLSYRLRHTYVCCGDWSRICGPITYIQNRTNGRIP